MLANILKSCKHYSFRNIITSDECWFCIRHIVGGSWISDDENALVCESDKFSVMKIMITVMWNVHIFHIRDFLFEGSSFKREYMIEHILAPLADKKIEIWSSGDKRKIWIHLDNCRIHNSKKTSAAIDRFGSKRSPHPAYSLDIAPSDFFLFGYTKTKLKGHYFESVNNLIEEIKKIFSDISYEKRFLRPGSKDVNEWLKMNVSIMHANNIF